MRIILLRLQVWPWWQRVMAGCGLDAVKKYRAVREEAITAVREKEEAV